MFPFGLGLWIFPEAKTSLFELQNDTKYLLFWLNFTAQRNCKVAAVIKNTRDAKNSYISLNFGFKRIFMRTVCREMCLVFKLHNNDNIKVKIL